MLSGCVPRNYIWTSAPRTSPGFSCDGRASGWSPPMTASLQGVAIGSFRDIGEGEGSIDLLVVADRFRRRGIARRLVTTLESHFASHGCTRDCRRGQPALLRLARC
jgi:ribosomal protein S18 acetylase RimI-like enzyme